MNDLTSDLSQLLSMLVPGIPLILAYLAGMILAIATWSKHAKVSMFILLACLIGLLNSIALSWLTLIIPRQIVFQDFGNPESMARFYLIMGIIRSVLGATTISFLVLAALGWRGRPLQVEPEA